ncbi:MAG: hypothetical protein QOD52_934, partial [Gaiellaceae bacterium]|nr:hypothetical protein [Gaiellaceae bacterium]
MAPLSSSTLAKTQPQAASGSNPLTAAGLVSRRWEHRQETLIAQLRRDADVRDEEVAALRESLDVAEHELEDLRAIRDALAPPELPERLGLELAAAFLPAA